MYSLARVILITYLECTPVICVGTNFKLITGMSGEKKIGGQKGEKFKSARWVKKQSWVQNVRNLWRAPVVHGLHMYDM